MAKHAAAEPQRSVSPSSLSLLGRLLIALVRAYQITFARLLPEGICLYEPTCSHYMIGAIFEHGAWRGALLGIWRICRCHPLARGGYDPVPPKGLPFLTAMWHRPMISEKNG